MKRTLHNALRLLFASALLLPLAATAQTEARPSGESIGKGPMAPMSVSPFAPTALLTEGFTTVAGSPNGCVAGWSCQNLSVAGGSTGWAQGGPTIPAQAGPATSYISANFNNTAGNNTISNWLITPQVNFTNGAVLRFWTRVAGTGAFPDRLEVRISTAAASTNVGATPTSVGDFTTLVATINPSLLAGAGACPPAAGPYPTAYCEIVLSNAQGIPAAGTGRIALRYFVTNGGPAGVNSNFIGIDTFSYDDAPLPPLPPATPLQGFDGVTPPALVAGWTRTSNNATNWVSATPGTPAANTPPNVMQVDGTALLTDASLISQPFMVTATPSQLVFSRSHLNLETGFDGMVLEVSLNGGAFADAVTAGGSFVGGGYNGTIDGTFGSAIGGRSAWTGNQAVFTTSTYQLPAAATVGSVVRFRWRMATDSSVTSGMVQIDSVAGVNLGGYIENFDGVTAPALPLGWAASNPTPGNGILWTTSTTAVPVAPHTPPNHAIIDDQAGISDKVLDSPNITVTGTGSSLSFRRFNNIETNFDGLVLEMSLNGGAFVDAVTAGGTFPVGAYNGTISVNFGSPIAGRSAWTGNTTTYVTTTYNLPAAITTGSRVRFRWRMATDATASGIGARIDTITGVNLVIVPEADLAITLTDVPDPVVAGTQLTYTATAINNGAFPADGVSISLPLPAGTTFVSATPSAGGTCVGTTTVVCTWAGATGVGAPNARSVVIVVTVNASTTANLTATATAASTTFDPAAGNNAATATTTVNASADLTLTLTDAPDPVTAGTNLTYTATLTNGGPSDAQGMNIVLPLPVGTTLVSATASAGGACTGTTTVTCTWAGASAPTTARTATIVVLVSSAQTANLSATATGSSSTTDPTSPNTATATTAVVTSANISVTLTDSPDPVTAGQNLTYVATVSNAGPSDSAGVVVTIPTPANTSFVSGTVAGGGSCSGGVTITCTFTGTVVAGGSRAATIVVLVAASTPNGTVITATATATATTPDPAVPNTATTTTTVATSANLALAFNASATQVNLNDPVIFTATSTNLGPSDAQNVQITITLSPDFRFSSLTASAGATCTSPQVGLSGAITCTWAGGTAPNATRTLAVTAYSNSPGTSSILASTSSPTADPVTTNNTLSVSVTVGAPFEPIPSLDLRGLLLLGMLIGLIGFIAIRRQN